MSVHKQYPAARIYTSFAQLVMHKLQGTNIAEVNRTLILTICLVVLVIFALLGTPLSLYIASATIPVSILGTFIVMPFLSYSIYTFHDSDNPSPAD